MRLHGWDTITASLILIFGPQDLYIEKIVANHWILMPQGAYDITERSQVYQDRFVLWLQCYNSFLFLFLLGK